MASVFIAITDDPSIPQYILCQIGNFAHSACMAALTEADIFAKMSDALASAISHCRDLATNNSHGPTYNLLRHELQEIEGCCRQASAWREDTRWLPIGLMMAATHKKAGEWLRGYSIPGMIGRVYPSRKVFDLLAANLEALKKQADGLRHNATGRIGMILPETPKSIVATQGRSMQVKLPSNLILAA